MKTGNKGKQLALALSAGNEIQLPASLKLNKITDYISLPKCKNNILWLINDYVPDDDLDAL